MKVRGTSDFLVVTAMERGDVLVEMQDALDRFRLEHPQVLEAVVKLGDELRDLRVQIILRSDSYGDAEDLMSELGPRLTAAVEADLSTSVKTGATELVPA